jgi:hypothetical protein
MNREAPECEVEEPQGRRKYDDLKMIGLIGTLLALILGWFWKSIDDRWTVKEQSEYRRQVDIQIGFLLAEDAKLEVELDRLREQAGKCR